MRSPLRGLAAGLLVSGAFCTAALADNLRGAWSPVVSWPVISVHAVLTPDGRVLTYGTDTSGRQTGYFTYDIWDPSTGLPGVHTTLPNATSTDIFCSSQLVLPQSGNVFIAGGDNWTGTSTTNTGNNNSNVFALSDNSLTRGNNMNRARWYSTSTVLTNGEVLIQGGSSGEDRPEIRAVNGTFRLLSGVDTSGLTWMYPRNFIAPDGRLVGYDGEGRMYTINPAGNGSITMHGQFAAQYRGTDSSAAMYRPGQVLQFGGNSNGAIIIDFTGATPRVTPTQSMSSQRRLVNAAVLADGKVLATGGSQVWNQLTGVNNIAEIWNPATGQWTQGAVGDRARLYHSVSLLLPDASVLVGGGGAPGPQVNTNIEIYYPPYLFNSTGTRVVDRLQLLTAPDTLEIGRTFDVGISPGRTASRVTLVKTGSVTHSWNMDQRFIELPFNQRGANLRIQAPARAGEAPPGFYMLFVFDASGVPSVAKIVKIGVAANPNPALVPTIANPGNQSAVVDVPVDLSISASDPNGDTLGYGASGLPPGLVINAQTGRITGRPTAAGNYNVTIAVSDGINSATASFVWAVVFVNPLTLAPLPAPTPQLAGSVITFRASASNGVNARYSWQFDDGTPPTAWSSSGERSHTFSNPGVYFVTVTVTDDRGLRQSQTIVQAIHLPLTANKPTSSSNIAFENRGTGRIWVVNQDNDSVSVLSAANNTRLAEIAVGSAPRSVAIAPNGMVWVANKLSASLSVIDPASLAVARTVSLPYGSQPFGIAFAPSGGAAFVTLEASGAVVKIDAASYATLAITAVGANPRGIAVTADGARVLVSRFITPPLPGESTANVAVSGGTPAGGELVVLSASSMAVQGTTVLRHSDIPDSENQGRGIPNYLGSAAISPDGRSAWVPSKLDNVRRGALRDGLPLNFQNTVRAVSSVIDMTSVSEISAARMDHDNASLASAAAFDPLGVYLFVALETSREVAIIDAHGRWEMFRIDVGRAPQGLALSADGWKLYVSNFMDRTVEVFDLAPLRRDGRADVPFLARVAAIGTERLSAQVLLGKQLFYDARDTRLARDRYMSCASCHSDGGHDGRVWDLTGFGEGLRNTINLRGRDGAQGFLHWSNNFDEVQDFEGQIRNLAGGTGLMSNTAFATGTRAQPLGDAKAGVSADLDALAAYVASLSSFDQSPQRSSSGALTSDASLGREVFRTLNCAACHAGTDFTASGRNTLIDVGTQRSTSGQRLGGPLTGIDPPTLRDVWATAPYLHDGSAATLEDAVNAHRGISVSETDMPRLVAYLQQIGSEDSAAPQALGSGAGLTARYFNNINLTGTPALTRTENVNFNWGSGSPGAAINANDFSVRWTGLVQAPATGSYRFQTVSDDGVRLWVNGQLMINNWTLHGATTDTSGWVNLQAGQFYSITMEFYERSGSAVARLRWQRPGNTTFGAIPADRLFAN